MAITPGIMARSLKRLGWVGFWLQVVLGFIPILVLIIRMFFSPRPFNTSLGLLLTIACLLALLLAMFWCFYYVLLARRLEDERSRPTKAGVMRSLWLGLKINIIGMSCGVIIAMGRLGILTINMLRLPQGATVITSGTGNNNLNISSLISPAELITIQAVLNTIAAQLIGIIITLLLLNQLTRNGTNAEDKSM